MGHRALIAYKRTDGTYNLHYSHWGACSLRLKHAITEDTPYGGSDPEAQWPREVHDALTNGAPVETVRERYHLGRDNDSQTDVEPIPQVVGVSVEEAIARHLNYLTHEAFYVVTPAFEVTAYRTHWFGLQYDSESVTDAPAIGNGALRTVRWYDGEPVGDGYTQGEFRALKRVVGDMIDRGVFTQDQAIAYMSESLNSWTTEQADLIIRTPEQR
jgi:hypothetical protein